MNTHPFKWNSRKTDQYFCRRDGVAVKIAKREPAGAWHVDVRRWSQPCKAVETIEFQGIAATLEDAQRLGELQFKFALSKQRRGM